MSPEVQCQICYTIGSCIDPKGIHGKPCQDNAVVLCDAEKIVVLLFDGHGADGEAVVAKCEQYARRYFNEKATLHDPETYIQYLLEYLDHKLGKSVVDCSCSGTTAIGVLIYGDHIYCASVGDSRAIAGLNHPLNRKLVPQGSMRAVEKQMIQKAFGDRLPVPTRQNQLYSLQLTLDQKPGEPSEKERILAAGGQVRKLSEDGPERVCNKIDYFPGLAMSRSLGDFDARACGVISTPVLRQLSMTEADIGYLVLASDGLWDVMNNQQVLDFISAFQDTCQTSSTDIGLDGVKSAENSTLSDLLVEEARVRWIPIVEETYQAIDDITVVVVKFENVAEKNLLAVEMNAPGHEQCTTISASNDELLFSGTELHKLT